MSSQSPTLWGGVETSYLKHVLGTLRVSSVTHRMKVFDIPTELYHIAIIRRSPVLSTDVVYCAVRARCVFRQVVARTNVCIIPGNNFLKSQRVAVSCHCASPEKTPFPTRVTTSAPMILRSAGHLASQLFCCPTRALKDYRIVHETSQTKFVFLPDHRHVQLSPSKHVIRSIEIETAQLSCEH